MDLCRWHASQCVNNGTCMMNYTLNRTYCLCPTCFDGDFCEDDRPRQTTYNTKYVYLIIYSVALAISVLNNGMSLELFIRCRSIRRTNSGVYLIINSTLALLGGVLLLMDGIVDYHRSIFDGDPQIRDRFHCVVGVAGYNTAVFLCIWFSACLQLERGLLVFRAATRNSTRKQSIIVSILLLVMGVVCSIPIAAYNCDWDGVPSLKTARVVLMFFHIAIPVIIYIVATVILMIGFANRIRAYRLETHSYPRTFLKLIYSHLFIFIPPIVYGLCFSLFNFVASKETEKGYFQCGISLGEYVVKVLLRALVGLPFAITWLIFVYPSRIYRNEFYSSTWCGQWTAWLIFGFQRGFTRPEDPVSIVETNQESESP